MQEIFDAYNKKILDRATHEGREMSIKSMAFFAEVSEDTARVFLDKCGSLPSEFYREIGDGKELSITESLQKLERVLKIRKVAKLTR